jgi:hypothetical protein
MRAFLSLLASLAVFSIFAGEQEKEKMNTQSESCCAVSDQPCCGTKSSAKASTPAAKRTIKIEFLYLDLTVCSRCKVTNTSVEESIKVLQPALAEAGVELSLEKIHVRDEADAKQHRFAGSPTIRVNGKDISASVEVSKCTECGDLCDATVDCRTWTWKGQTYAAPPKGMVIDAILGAVYGQAEPASSAEYEMPENLKKFFAGLKAKTGAKKK